MNHNFFAFLCFLLALSSLQGTTLATLTSNPAKFRRLYDAVTDQGQIVLQKDSVGFFVNVDFAYNPDDASDSEAADPDIGAMSIALYTSETILSESCLQFSDYNCTEFECYAYTQRAKVYLPYFVAEGHLATSSVYLDYNYWYLENEAVIATTCTQNTYSPYGSDRYGILGLGQNTTQSNFIDSTLFSITLERDASSGTLLFESNSNITESSTFVATLTASANWHIDASDATITIDDTETSFSGKIIFDLDATEIGFPSSLYQSIIDNFQSANPEVGGCTSETYQPSCGYNGKIKDLKTITLTVQGQNIDIPSTVYVQGYTDGETDIDGTITLNFRSLDPTYTDYSYVTETYSNYIILDQNFLSYYYAEFSGSFEDYTVTLQTIYSNDDGDSGCPTWVYIVGGVGGFFVLSLFTCCICGCIKRRRDKRRAACKRVFQTEPIVNETDQTGLVNNDQVASNLPYPAQNNYYYPPPVYAYNQNGNYQYPQQFQQPTQPAHAYGNMPGYTYIPQTGAYPYLPPGQGQVTGQLPYGQSGQNNQ